MQEQWKVERYWQLRSFQCRQSTVKRMKKLQPIPIRILNRIQISIDKNCIRQIIKVGIDSSNHREIRTGQTRCQVKGDIGKARVHLPL